MPRPETVGVAGLTAWQSVGDILARPSNPAFLYSKLKDVDRAEEYFLKNITLKNSINRKI